ncbi:hypothetical protein [Lutispora sp.]|uniref:hypothetical protein n=1 Tax=Lutispora sp. TaxID=2828727 RepID=UPI0035618AE0
MALVIMLISAVAACESGVTENRNGTVSASGAGTGTASLNNEVSIKVGFSIASFQEERWLVDRDIFIAKCNELGAEVILQSANGNAELQVE